MAGFGLAAGAGFASGFGQAFTNSFHQQQEIQLQRQRLQMEQQREMLSRAEDDRAKLAKTIEDHAQSLLAQGNVPTRCLRPLRDLSRAWKGSRVARDIRRIQSRRG
jgi:hypothetical protein